MSLVAAVHHAHSASRPSTHRYLTNFCVLLTTLALLKMAAEARKYGEVVSRDAWRARFGVCACAHCDQDCACGVG